MVFHQLATRERLVAVFALVGAFAGVDAEMAGQVVLLDEAPPTHATQMLLVARHRVPRVSKTN